MKFCWATMMFRGILNMFYSPMNRTRMVTWTTEVDRMVSRPPGTDDGFSQKDIDRNSKANFSKLSTWEIVCQEILDTEHPCIYYQRARMELRQRGISDDEYEEMRRFAWLTAGWLNFVKMLWDWCSLDEKDIYRAIEWQYSDGWISRSERDSWILYADRYANVEDKSHPLETADEPEPNENHRR